MSERDQRARATIAVCAAVVAFAVGYALPIAAGAPSLEYRPAAGVVMGYFGQQIWGAGAALLVGAVTWLLLRGRAPRDATVALASAWALTALALVGIYFTWHNWP